jgi:HAD superfamily hydrolase (TIGR01509 family)
MGADALAFARARRRGLTLVIFDCDGVLIDSEPICDRVVSSVLTEAGWPLTPAECHEYFLGLSFPAMQPLVEAKLGRPLPVSWVDQVGARVSAVLAEEGEPIPGAADALCAATALGLPWRVASNSSRQEMAVKFRRAGLAVVVTADRIHSAYDVIARGGNGKPAPDLFLEAAAAEGVDPADCVVVEDSLPGVRAALAAGMDCLAFCPDGDGGRLRAAGAVPFASMHDLPAILDAMQRAAAR